MIHKKEELLPFFANKALNKNRVDGRVQRMCVVIFKAVKSNTLIVLFKVNIPWEDLNFMVMSHFFGIFLSIRNYKLCEYSFCKRIVINKVGWTLPSTLNKKNIGSFMHFPLFTCIIVFLVASIWSYILNL